MVAEHDQNKQRIRRKRYSGPRDGNKSTQNGEYQREANGPTPNGENTLQIGLQVKCGPAIQYTTKVTHVPQ